jgi:hypothetical protein
MLNHLTTDEYEIIAPVLEDYNLSICLGMMIQVGSPAPQKGSMKYEQGTRCQSRKSSSYYRLQQI